MTPQERAAKIEFQPDAAGVNLMGQWELDEDGARDQIAAAIREAVAQEREACAMTCLELAVPHCDARDCADAIRARGK